MIVTFGIAYLPLDRSKYVASASRVERALFGPGRPWRLEWIRDGFVHEIVTTIEHAPAAWYAARERAKSWNALHGGILAVPYVELPTWSPGCPQCHGPSRWNAGWDPADPMNLVPDVCEACDREGGRPW